MTATPTVLRTEDEQLRRFVVRIDTPDGATGTGVLVAPGWVLTCAHVVGGVDAVGVVPDPDAVPEGSHTVVPLWVDARMRTPPPSSAPIIILGRPSWEPSSGHPAPVTPAPATRWRSPVWTLGRPLH